VPTVDLSSFHLTFDDEFNSFSASPNGSGTTWETKYWWGGRTLNGVDYYLDPSVGGLGQTPYSISNGVLDIHAQPTSPELKADGVTSTFTTGQIDTHNSFSQEYGYFEMRAQVSNSYGTNNAFWLMPMSGPWPPEVDVTEVLGRDPKTDFMTNHTDASNPTSHGGTATGVDLSQGFHTYGLMWTPTTLTFYLDGVAEYTTPTQPDEHQPMYLLATLGVGSSWPGNPDPANFSADMKIDYIRAYSSDTAVPAVHLQPVSSPDGVDTTPYGATTADGALTHSAGSGTTGGSGSTGTTGALVIQVSEDVWKGDAQFTVFVDGQQSGGTYTATVSHALHQVQDVAIDGTFSASPHTVDVHFTNDAWGGTATADRNLYVQGISLNGETLLGSDGTNNAANGATTTDGSAPMDINGTVTFHTATTTPTTPAPLSTIVLHVAEDTWNGDAQFKVLIDGQQIGGTYTATMSHAAGQWQDVTVTGDLGNTGPGHVDVQFVNDAWGGTAATDRNLYVQSIDVNGQHFAASMATNAAANGMSTTDGSAILAINGMVDFNVNHTAAPTDWHLV
jgi:beta-glucanase (GH16 family)